MPALQPASEDGRSSHHLLATAGSRGRMRPKRESANIGAAVGVLQNAVGKI